MSAVVKAALHELSIAEASRALRDGALTATALTEHALARITALDPALDAFVVVTRERALADASRADDELRRGIDRGPMHGIPYGLKDIYDTAGIRTTCHSHLRSEIVPAADSDVAARLAAGGGVLLGKLATHEFAIGGPSFDLPFPPARNPWHRDYIPGGSSSGSGAAVAAGMVRMAMGSDTGGSIRGPACYCGIVGLKPTYGRVSRRGVFPLSYSLDHCGPLTRTVEDAALAMQVLAGFDPFDPMSAEVPVPDFRAGLGQDLHGLKLAYPRRFFAAYPHTAPEVIAAMDAAVEVLARLGAQVEQVELPRYELFEACGRVILEAEAYAIHEQDLKARPLAYGRYTYQRIAAGAVLSAADLMQAYRLKRELATLVNRQVLTEYDGIVTAIGLTPAPRFDQFERDITRWTTMQAIQFNVTGNPALSVPVGISADGLPLGMQIVGRLFDEPTVLRIGAAYEAATEWRGATPPLAAIVR